MMKPATSWRTARMAAGFACWVVLLTGCKHLWPMPPQVPSPPQVPPPDLPPRNPEPQPRPQPADYPTALPVPGRAGFVFSPYNNKMIDVQGMAAGSLVADPHYPAGEHKYFRVP